MCSFHFISDATYVALTEGILSMCMRIVLHSSVDSIALNLCTFMLQHSNHYQLYSFLPTVFITMLSLCIKVPSQNQLGPLYPIKIDKSHYLQRDIDLYYLRNCTFEMADSDVCKCKAVLINVPKHDLSLFSEF